MSCWGSTLVRLWPLPHNFQFIVLRSYHHMPYSSVTDARNNRQVQWSKSSNLLSQICENLCSRTLSYRSCHICLIVVCSMHWIVRFANICLQIFSWLLWGCLTSWVLLLVMPTDTCALRAANVTRHVPSWTDMSVTNVAQPGTSCSVGFVAGGSLDQTISDNTDIYTHCRSCNTECGLWWKSVIMIFSRSDSGDCALISFLGVLKTVNLLLLVLCKNMN
jgi:hypothetical protein